MWVVLLYFFNQLKMNVAFLTQFSKDFCLISAAGMRPALNLVRREETVNSQVGS